jgi:D-aminoacyl-tRNA deacylase
VRAVVQRVKKSAVEVDDRQVGVIGQGILVFLGVGQDDGQEDVDYMAEKISNLRIFEDNDGKMNLSLLDVQGEALIISQFTLFGDCRKGRRPNFMEAASPDKAIELYDKFVQKVKAMGVNTQEGIFQAHMYVDILNDGPVTLILDSKKNF